MPTTEPDARDEYAVNNPMQRTDNAAIQLAEFQHRKALEALQRCVERGDRAGERIAEGRADAAADRLDALRRENR